MVKIIGSRDPYIDDEEADLSMLADVHSMAGKNATLRELGVANLERRHAFLRRMKPDCNPWMEEKKIEETRKLDAIKKAEAVKAINDRRQKVRDRIWARFVPLSKRIDFGKERLIAEKNSKKVRYTGWNVEGIPGLEYTGETKVKDSMPEEDDEDDYGPLREGALGTGLVQRIMPRRVRNPQRIQRQAAEAAALRKIDQAIRWHK
ncbi:hypothetical protein COY05_03230 [Candidatus Peregrinibacteria bacterium CG_4_10_14_0_2_um_filter_38_24]|nr:MAG: hypothetical protein COY05_03230 [Candidatus Peregrinibacteria bacterium CG_4_10_14_0_2_um_filter_38_24]